MYEGTRIQTIKLRLVMTRESSTAQRACCHRPGCGTVATSGPNGAWPTAVLDAVMAPAMLRPQSRNRHPSPFGHADRGFVGHAGLNGSSA